LENNSKLKENERNEEEKKTKWAAMTKVSRVFGVFALIFLILATVAKGFGNDEIFILFQSLSIASIACLIIVSVIYWRIESR
jgi:hypothetical protein